MSIASEITRLQTAKSDLKTSIENKEVAVSSSATLDEYPPLVDAIPTGGGGLEPKLVNFIDYDGTLLYSYDDEEFAELTALPSNPTHTDMGLVPDGWNWTLAEIQAQLTAMPEQKVWVGQMYHTASGATEIDITIDDFKDIATRLGVEYGETVYIDYGDGTIDSKYGGTQYWRTSNTSASHSYTNSGNYTIKIYATNGADYSFSRFMIGGYTTYSWGDYVIGRGITAMRLGKGIAFPSYFYPAASTSIEYCTFPSGTETAISGEIFTRTQRLKAVVIPSGIQTITSQFISRSTVKTISFPSSVTTLTDTLRYAYAVRNFTFPSGLTSLGVPLSENKSAEEAYFPANVTIARSNAMNASAIKIVSLPSAIENCGYACQNDYLLEEATIRNTTTALPNSLFSSCFNLKKVTITSGQSSLLSIGNSVFQSCYALKEFKIPSTVTSIGSSAFVSCYSIKSITIPQNVTSIGASAFGSMFSLSELKFEPTTPPTLGGSNTFSNLPPWCKIYVPSGTLSAYTSATNYPNPNTYTYIEY